MVKYIDKNDIYKDNYDNILLIFFIIIIFILFGLSHINKINKKILIIIGFIIFIIFLVLKPTKNKIKIIIQNINDDNYDIIIIDNFLTDKECDDLINYSKNQKMIISEITGNNGNVYSDYRKSQQIWISDNEHLISKKISDYCMTLLDLPKKNMESLQLVRYDISGYFKQHYDAEPDKTKKSNIIDRAHTFIVYLNDVEEGGGTEFPNLQLKFQPKKGMALYFKTLKDNGELLQKSLHQGLPIINGEKYIVNKWIHLYEFNK